MCHLIAFLALLCMNNVRLQVKYVGVFSFCQRNWIFSTNLHLTMYSLYFRIIVCFIYCIVFIFLLFINPVYSTGHASRCLLLLWSIIVCYSRYAMRRHHITDILAGCILGYGEYYLIKQINWNLVMLFLKDNFV
ncbi:unnamed protein product [Trichobilharzia regenti]|nr:unnamed protein product [Trichobilharzia regenti]